MANPGATATAIKPTQPVTAPQPEEAEAETVEAQSQILHTQQASSTAVTPVTIKAPKAPEITKEDGQKSGKKPIVVGGKPVSGLSLKSIQAKKEHEQAKKDKKPDTQNLPEDPFTEEAMQKGWNEYVEIIDKQGKKILSSALASDIPKLKNPKTIWIELPNDTMKKEVERDQYPLMEFLKEKLNNYYIDLEVGVNEQTAKQYAFTPVEKFQKMCETNPVLDLLRRELDLEV